MPASSAIFISPTSATLLRHIRYQKESAQRTQHSALSTQHSALRALAVLQRLDFTDTVYDEETAVPGLGGFDELQMGEQQEIEIKFGLAMTNDTLYYEIDPECSGFQMSNCEYYSISILYDDSSSHAQFFLALSFARVPLRGFLPLNFRKVAK